MGARFFLWSLPRVLIVKKFSIFLGCAFPGPLAREHAFVGVLFWGHSLAFLGCRLFQLQFGDFQGKNKNEGTHHDVLQSPKY